MPTNSSPNVQVAQNYLMGTNQQTTQQALATTFGVPVSSINPNVNRMSSINPNVNRMGASGLGGGGGGSFSSGEGGVSQPKPIQQFGGGSFDPNTGTFTDIYGNKSSTNNPSAISDKIVTARQVAEQKAFSSTGGINAPGQSSPFANKEQMLQKYQNDRLSTIEKPRKPEGYTTTGRQATGYNAGDSWASLWVGTNYFKTNTNDIQTDSQAIRTATNAADQITKNQVPKILGTLSSNNKPTRGEKVQPTLQENFDYLSRGTYTKIQDPKTGDIRGIRNPGPIEDFILTSAVLFPLGGIVASATGKVIGVVAKPVAKLLTPVAEPVIAATSKAISGAADDVFRMLSPAVPATVKNVAATTAKAASTPTGKIVVQQGKLLIKTETTGEAFRQAGLYTPEAVSTVYLAATPGRLFQPTEETKIAAGKTYTATRVSYYGGERQTVDETGKVISTEQVAGKAPMWESMQTPLGNTGLESFIPGIKVVTGFNPEFRTQTKEKVKDIPEYKALKTDAERQQYEKEFADYYLNVQQIGGQVGQVFIETGGEVSGGGRLSALSGGGIKTRAGAIGRFAVASGSAGVQEGVYSSELSAKVEQRNLTNQERINSALMGGAFAGGFGALQAGTMGTKFNKATNITGELIDYPGEPLGDFFGGKVKTALKVPDIQVGGGLVKTSFGPSIMNNTTTQTKSSTKQTKQPTSKTKGVMDFFFADQTTSQVDKARKGMGIPVKAPTKTSSNTGIPGTLTTGSSTDTKIDGAKIANIANDLPPPTIIGNVPRDTTDEQKEDQKQNEEQNVPSNTPSWATVPSTVPVIAPQGFLFPGFFPIAMGESSGAREKTKIYDELAAAGKRFQQISGLPFAQQQSIKRPKTVMVNGKEFRIGKRVKKK